MSEQPHEVKPGNAQSVGTQDLVFDCPHCSKSLAVDVAAAGQSLPCPSCKKSVTVPKPHKVVGLDEAPETAKLQSKAAWEQELISIESAWKETRHQREEAGNQFKQACSEANRLKLRIEKLDARLKELEGRKTAIQKEHPTA